MRVFFDTEPLLLYPSGISIYVSGLLHGFAELADPDLELCSGYASARSGLHRKLRRQLKDMGHSLPYHAWYLPGRIAGKLGPLRRFAALPMLPPIDIVHGTTYLIPPYVPAAKRVVVVYDVGFLRYPDRRFGGTGGDNMSERARKCMQEADAVLTISEFSKREISEVCVVPESRIHVAYLSTQWDGSQGGSESAESEILGRYGLTKKGYLLSVGLISPRKNYETLLDAFSQLRESNPDARLVLVGAEGWDVDPVIERMRKLGEAVCWITRCDSNELQVLYRNARFFAMLSWYEGFGIPVLEALQMGCPTIIADGSSMGEVGGDAVLTVNPKDVDGAAVAMSRLWSDSDLAASLVQTGYSQAGKFSWKKTAEQTLDAYRALLA